MSRYRIRFQLQEIDLSPGETVLGRSPECHLTLEDPLVSRTHAKIHIKGDSVMFEDLGSRNGSRVNGIPIRGSVVLKDNDRLRIGTQEMVFCRVASVPTRSANRITGFLLYCAGCGMPYPEEVLACPSCGAKERVVEEATLSGSSDSQTSTWAIQLLAEVIDRGVRSKHFGEAERAARRARTAVDDRLSQSSVLEASHLDGLALAICSYVGACQDPSWIRWLLDTYARSGLVPSAESVARMRSVVPVDSGLFVQELERVLTAPSHHAATLGQSDHGGVEALKSWLEEARKQRSPQP